jgi:hypothetical protein
MKQTAVEWFAEQMEHPHIFNPLIEEALDMEREQLIDCGNSCALMQHIHIDKINKMTESEIRQFAEEEHLTFGEQYYNETFKSIYNGKI